MATITQMTTALTGGSLRITLPMEWTKEKFIATKSFEIMYRDATAAATNVWGRWNITTKVPSILDKLRSKQKLTSEEQQIADNLDLEDNLAVGSLPMQPSLIERRTVWPQFQKIEPIYRNLALLAANSSVVVGYDIRKNIIKTLDSKNGHACLLTVSLQWKRLFDLRSPMKQNMQLEQRRLLAAHQQSPHSSLSTQKEEQQ